MMAAGSCSQSSSPDLLFSHASPSGDNPDLIRLPDPTWGTRANTRPATPVLRNFSYPSHFVQTPRPISRQSRVMPSRIPSVSRDIQPSTPISTPIGESPNTSVRTPRETNDKELFDPHFSVRQSGSSGDQDGPPRKKRRSVLSLLSASQVHNRLFHRRASSASNTIDRRLIPSPERIIRKKKSFSDLISYAAFPRRKRPFVSPNQSRPCLGSFFQTTTAISRANLKRPASSSSGQAYQLPITPKSHKRAQSVSMPISEIAKLEISDSMEPPKSKPPLSTDQEPSITVAVPPQTSSSLGTARWVPRNHVVSNKAKSNAGKTKWLANLKGWVTIGEPSTPALKHGRLETSTNVRVTLDHTRTDSRLHTPIRAIPAYAAEPVRSDLDLQIFSKKRAGNR